MGTIFVAGAYGVGKSTLCNSLAQVLDIPSFSAGDLISQANGERYGANKTVQSKHINQDILAQIVAEILGQNSTILLAGHFCIFDKNNNVDILPSGIFRKLQIKKLLLLEASEERIIANLNRRDGKQYNYRQVSSLLSTEHAVAKKSPALLASHYTYIR